MPRWLRLLLLLSLCAIPARSAGPADFAGTWVLRANDGRPADTSEVYTFELDRTWFRVVMRIDDSLGKRTTDFSGALDGKPHHLTVADTPATFTGKWEPDGSLTWETRREAFGMVLDNRRTMHLSPDGKTLIARRTRISPDPEETWTETWERPAAARSGFNGTWRLENTEPGWGEVYTIQHDDTFLRVIQRIEGGTQQGVLGTRTLDVSGAIDGAPHRQTVQGFPCTFIAKWDGPHTLIWETRRELPDGFLHYRRIMRLSDDGQTILAERTQLGTNPPDIRREVWRRVP